jgi:hypothetical protein
MEGMSTGGELEIVTGGQTHTHTHTQLEINVIQDAAVTTFGHKHIHSHHCLIISSSRPFVGCMQNMLMVIAGQVKGPSCQGIICPQMVVF